jgi:hypothetical protein
MAGTLERFKRPFLTEDEAYGPWFFKGGREYADSIAML